MWNEQCDAAEGIRDRFGWQKAAGYLIGEKLVGYLNHGPALSQPDQQAFRARVLEIFPREHIEEYFSQTQRSGPLSHIVDQEQYGEMVSLGMVETSPAAAAADLLAIEKARQLLLG